MGHYLEAVCDSYLKWQARKSIFTYNTLVGWASSSEHMLRDGAFRVAAFLQRIATGEMPISGDASGAGMRGNHPQQQRTMQLGAVVFGVSLLMAITGERIQLGVNLFTAEVVLMVAAALMLVRTIRGRSRVA